MKKKSVREVISEYTYIMPLFHFEAWTTSIRISSQIKIRKMDKNEIYSLDRHTPSVLDDFEKAAISYAMEAKSKNGKLLWQMYEKFQEIILAFRLLKAGPLYGRIVFMIRPNSSVMATWKSVRIPPNPEFYKLNIEDLEQFRGLYRTITKLQNLKPQNKSLAIALKFFEKSYEDDLETAIVSSWTAFEALCLKGEEGTGETGKTVKIAISMLLGKNEMERDAIKNCLATAYKARNHIVHGIERETKGDLAIVENLQNYLRKCIIRLIS